MREHLSAKCLPDATERLGDEEKGYFLSVKGELASSKLEFFDRLINEPGLYRTLLKLFLTGDGNAAALKGESHSLFHREVGVGVIEGCHDDELLTSTKTENNKERKAG